MLATWATTSRGCILNQHKLESLGREQLKNYLHTEDLPRSITLVNLTDWLGAWNCSSAVQEGITGEKVNPLLHGRAVVHQNSVRTFIWETQTLTFCITKTPEWISLKICVIISAGESSESARALFEWPKWPSHTDEVWGPCAFSYWKFFFLIENFLRAGAQRERGVGETCMGHLDKECVVRRSFWLEISLGSISFKRHGSGLVSLLSFVGSLATP